MLPFRRLAILALLLTTYLSGLAQTAVQIRTAPRPQGNYYPLSQQTAYNTMLLSRIASGWTKPANRYLLWQGPVLASPTERQKLFDNGGVTHLMIPDATNPMGLPGSKRGNFPGGHGAHELATALGNSLADGDAKKMELLNYGLGANRNNAMPYYVRVNEPAYRLLGGSMYENSIGANGGTVPSMWGCDLEDHEDAPGTTGGALQMPISVYEGAKTKIVERGANTMLYTYGTASLARVINHTNNAQDADIGMRLPGDAWIEGGFFSASGARTAVFRQGAYVGQDKYLRRVWDDASLFQKNSDGSIKTDGNGKAIYYYGARTITNYGQSYPTYRTESEYFNDMWYSEADKLLAEWRFRCNTPVSGYSGNFVNMPIPKGTVDIRPGMENVKVISYFRNNAETERLYDPLINDFEPLYVTPELGEEAANQRPLYPQSIEFAVLFRTVLNEMVYIFGNEGNYADWQLGKLNQHGAGNGYFIRNRWGQFEQMLKASHRGRNFPELFKVMDAKKALFILPWRFVVNGNKVGAEQQTEKPIFWGIKESGGRRMWAMWVFPTQDVANVTHERDIKMWIELPSGAKSPTYLMHCKDRVTGFDQFLLPAGFENAQPEDYRFEFTGLLRGPYFRTGNYNILPSGTPVAPTAANSTLTTYTLPTN